MESFGKHLKLVTPLYDSYI